MRAENQPVAAEGATKSEEGAAGDRDHTPQSRGRVGSTSSIIRKLMEKVVKPKPQTIHSGTISEEERHSTLAPFAMPGITINKVNRDYEAFFKTAWDDPSSSSSKSNAAATPQTPAFSVLPHHLHGQAELDHREPAHPRKERKTDQPSRPQRPPANVGGRLRAFTTEDDLSESKGGGGGGGSRSPPRSPQLRKAKQLSTPEVGLQLHVRVSCACMYVPVAGLTITFY